MRSIIEIILYIFCVRIVLIEVIIILIFNFIFIFFNEKYIFVVMLVFILDLVNYGIFLIYGFFLDVLLLMRFLDFYYNKWEVIVVNL